MNATSVRTWMGAWAANSNGKPTGYRAAAADLISGLYKWPAWTALAWDDIQGKYRRTILGPFWITAGLGTFVLSVGFIYPRLFGTTPGEYLPYLSVGVVVWALISTIVTESANILLNGGGMLKQMPLPLSFIVFQFVYRNALIFAHNFLIYVAIAAVLKIHLGFGVLLFLPALALTFFTAVALGFLFGMIGARFRDIPQVITSGIQVIFFITPIFWRASDLPQRAAFILWNPFYHYIEILRAPLLGGSASLESWSMAIGCTTILWILAFRMLAHFRHRVVFWV